MRTLMTLLLALSVSACVPNPTNEDCHRKADCLACVTSFCSWCGPRPGAPGERGRACYAAAAKPADCDPPPHFAFCYGGATDPIDNRMYLKRPDGGEDLGPGTSTLPPQDQ